MSLRPHLFPAILLVLPLLALNVAFAARLPAAYQPEVFQADIPAPLAFAENALRIAMFTLTAFFPLRACRFGWGLFLAGTALYCASWAALIVAPEAGWSTSWIGFTAPAWSPALWLAGIGLASRAPDFAPGIPWKTLFWLFAAAFLAAHLGHALLVWTRL